MMPYFMSPYLVKEVLDPPSGEACSPLRCMHALSLPLKKEQFKVGYGIAGAQISTVAAKEARMV